MQKYKTRHLTTMSLDADVYRQIQEDLPRGVSVSEIVSWILKAMFEDIKKGRELTQEEFDEWVESTPEGRDFRERLITAYGPTFKKIKDYLEKKGVKT